MLSILKSFTKKNKRFVSAIDEFLVDFDKKNPKSASQQAEIKKYKLIKLLQERSAKIR